MLDSTHLSQLCLPDFFMPISPRTYKVLPTFRDSITLPTTQRKSRPFFRSKRFLTARPGYPVYNKARQWVVRNQERCSSRYFSPLLAFACSASKDPVTGATYRNGFRAQLERLRIQAALGRCTATRLSEIPGLFVQFQLPTKLVPGDVYAQDAARKGRSQLVCTLQVIAIEAPTGFNFLTAVSQSCCKTDEVTRLAMQKRTEGPQDSCADFRWEPMEAVPTT